MALSESAGSSLCARKSTPDRAPNAHFASLSGLRSLHKILVPSVYRAEPSVAYRYTLREEPTVTYEAVIDFDMLVYRIAQDGTRSTFCDLNDALLEWERNGSLHAAAYFGAILYLREYEHH